MLGLHQDEWNESTHPDDQADEVVGEEVRTFAEIVLHMCKAFPPHSVSAVVVAD